MRIATWNVNSIRARAERVVDWLERTNVDVLAIQETKCSTDQFPEMGFAAAGYDVERIGYNQWNGVAIASRVGIEDLQTSFPDQPQWNDIVEARAISAVCGGVRVWSLYVPNGRGLEDPHMPYKLDWLKTLNGHARQWLADDPSAQIMLAGDWNIAPTDDDVWSVDYYADKSHISAPERAAFTDFVDAGYTDVVRPHAPGPGVYTYWDYTQLRFPRKEGMRIDFALCSPALAGRVTSAHIDREERKGKGASDHAPVVVDLD